MKKMMTIVWIALVAIGLLTVVTSIVVPLLPSSAPSQEAVALIGLSEEHMQDLIAELYGVDSHGLWTAIGIAGGIVALIGAVPLTVTIMKHRKPKTKKKK